MLIPHNLGIVITQFLMRGQIKLTVDDWDKIIKWDAINTEPIEDTFVMLLDYNKILKFKLAIEEGFPNLQEAVNDALVNYVEQEENETKTVTEKEGDIKMKFTVNQEEIFKKIEEMKNVQSKLFLNLSTLAKQGNLDEVRSVLNTADKVTDFIAWLENLFHASSIEMDQEDYKYFTSSFNL